MKNAKNVCKIAKVIELTNDNIRIGFIIKSIVIKRCIEKKNNKNGYIQIIIVLFRDTRFLF